MAAEPGSPRRGGAHLTVLAVSAVTVQVGLASTRCRLARRVLASLFSSRSAWEEHGRRVLEVLIAGEAWGLVETLVERSACREAAPAADPPPGLVGAIHEGLAMVLLRRARRALDDGSEAAAIAALHALSPPSRFSRKLVPLSREERFSADVRELIELNLRLHRHGTNRDAALSHIGATLALRRDVQHKQPAGRSS